MAREFSRGNSEAISIAGYTWARAGYAVKAREIWDELKSLSAQRYIPASNIATVYIALGEQDEAIAWLEKAYQERDVRLDLSENRSEVGLTSLRSQVSSPSSSASVCKNRFVARLKARPRRFAARGATFSLSAQANSLDLSATRKVSQTGG